MHGYLHLRSSTMAPQDQARPFFFQLQGGYLTWTVE
jgi:hypothetical protein